VKEIRDDGKPHELECKGLETVLVRCTSHKGVKIPSHPTFALKFPSKFFMLSLKLMKYAFCFLNKGILYIIACIF